MSMPHYAFYISDSRYSVPSLVLSDQPDKLGAKRLARQLLHNSPEHVAVDVYLDDQIVAHIAREQAAKAPRPSLVETIPAARTAR